MNGVNLKSFRNKRYYYRGKRYSTYYRRYGREKPEKERRRK